MPPSHYSNPLDNMIAAAKRLAAVPIEGDLQPPWRYGGPESFFRQRWLNRRLIRTVVNGFIQPLVQAGVIAGILIRQRFQAVSDTMRLPRLRAREVSRPTEQQDQHFLHKPNTFPLDTQILARRWCGLQVASGEAYSKRVQTFTTPYRGPVMTLC